MPDLADKFFKCLFHPHGIPNTAKLGQNTALDALILSLEATETCLALTVQQKSVFLGCYPWITYHRSAKSIGPDNPQKEPTQAALVAGVA